MISAINLIKSISILFLISVNLVWAQTELNIFQQRNIHPDIQLQALNKDSYRYNVHDNIIQKYADSVQYGLEINGSFKNNALSHYQVYNDNLKYALTPYLYYTLDENLSFNVRVNVENIRDKYLYNERLFWADEFSKHRGDFEIAKIEYKTKNITVKFGRDYFMPGIYLYENLLFSKYNYPYDQLNFKFNTDFFEISSFYLALNTLSETGITNQRHLNGHRITFNLADWGYLAFNDVMIYGGENKSIDLMSFNPLILFYPYRKNKKHLDGNNLMSLELFLRYKNYYLFTELLLDDYQADKKSPSDLEPAEWGANITVGVDNMIDKINWKINYTRIANRTFNAPDFNFEKFIYKNYPIGHFLGNNFWELKTTVTYNAFSSIISDLTFHYYAYGDEALYGSFNKDFLDYTVEEGYTEDFPFGNVKNQIGFDWITYYSINKKLLTQLELNYWLKNTILKDEFNFSLGFAYNL